MSKLLNYIVTKKNEKFKDYVNRHQELPVYHLKYALNTAISVENMEIVRFLLEEKNVPAYERSLSSHELLMTAIRVGNAEIVDMLMAKGASVAFLPESPLWYALSSRKALNPAFIRYVLEKMAEGPYRDRRHRGTLPFFFTPTDTLVDGSNYFHVLARSNASKEQTAELNKEIVEILLDAGVDLEATDDAGDTPLVAAARVGNLAFIEAALAVGIDMKPLYRMAREGQFTSDVNEAIQQMLQSRFGNVRILMQQPMGNSNLRLPNNIATEIAKFNTGLRLSFPGPKTMTRRNRRRRSRATLRIGSERRRRHRS